MNRMLKFLEKNIDVTSDCSLALGFLYEKGIGVDKNKEKSIEYLKISAEKGNVHANYYLTFLEEQELEYLFFGLKAGYSNAFNRLSYFIWNKRIDFNDPHFRKSINEIFF